MFTLNDKITKPEGKSAAALKRIQDFKDKYMQDDDWDEVDTEEKKRRIVELFELTESITSDQTTYMNEVTKGRAGDDFFSAPMEWVRRVEVCKSDRLKFDIVVLIPIFIKLVLVGFGFMMANVVGYTNPLLIPIVIGMVALVATGMRDIVRISKAAWVMGYVVATADTGAPLVRMFTSPQSRYLADQLVQISLKAISASELKRYQVMVNTHKVSEERLAAMGVKNGDELYAQLMTEHPKRAIIK